MGEAAPYSYGTEDVDIDPPHPRLGIKKSYILSLYFSSKADRRAYIAMVRSAMKRRGYILPAVMK